MARKRITARQQRLAAARERWHFETPIVGNLLSHPELQVDLDERDRRCIVVWTLVRVAESQVLAYRAPVGPSIEWCMAIAIDVVVRWEAAASTPSPERFWELVHEVVTWIKETGAGRKRALPSDPPRIRRVRELTRKIDMDLGAKRSLPKSLASIQKAAKTLELPNDESAARTYFPWTMDAKGAAWACFVDDEGDVAVGGRQARDALATRLKITRKRKRKTPLPVRASDLGDGTSGHVEVDAPVEADPAELIAALRAVTEIQHRSTPRSRDRQLVRQHLVELITGRISLSELARRNGRSKGAMHREFQKERALIATLRRES